MNDMLNGIPEFVEAVEAGGFSAAAARMNLSRSAIGKTIARLERRLNVRLFHRTTRMQNLTDEGQAFYERCRRALDEIQSGEAMLESGKREVTGRLRISMPVLFGRCCAAPQLLELARIHPKLELDLSFSDRVVDLFDEGFDLAIRNGVLRDEAGLAARKLTSTRMILCASPDYLASRGTPRTVADLGNHDLIAYARSGEVKKWTFLQEDGSAVEHLAATRLRFDDLEVLAAAASSGMGITWLPCWLVRQYLSAGTLVPAMRNISSRAVNIYAVWPQTPHLPLKMRVVIDLLAERLPAIMD
ncbi:MULTISPECIES: LysR family transcriptional regulator [unclassified Rhizobium]|jgi:DNA-binding transcriptional LysR family regulator|uniref:LysR family transcriptional regulator n=1 Tax=unclassified Rhizobium TaxID=2613769 RepID=UPI0006478CDE|nr:MULTISPECIES: LysR family transcriptional regulator [unclassified Rhizobium]MBN8950298.1 LysR family transcriptional regulator [Rhizobium tropici]OJY68837.1 MAG: LysR family transcriptional regulator [Rhizobium sp. 60-20]RKD74404.1 LysR family transcriptional regulator [Rhizobium sp. WW_1]